MPYLDDIAVRFQVYMEGLKTSDYREFNKVVPLIEQEVRAALARGEFVEINDKAFATIVRKMSEKISGHLDDATGTLLDKLKAFSLYSYQFEAGALVSAAPSLDLSKKLKANVLYEQVKARPLSANGELLEPWIQRLTGNEVLAVESLLRRGRVEGWTNSQMAQVLKGKRSNGFKDGLLVRLGRQNETMVRTAVQHVNSVGRQALWEENADIVKQYRWVSTLDRKTSETCRGLDGKQFDLGEGPLPPIHPNCRSTTVAVLDKKYDIFDKGATRASETGSVPQKQTYYEWLSDQPAKFQDSVIGPERGALLRDGGLSVEEFTRLNLSSTFKPLTLEQMRRLKPLAFLRAGI